MSWAKRHYTGDLKIFYYSQSDHDRSLRKLKTRFAAAEAVTGIMSNHSFKVVGKDKLEMKKYSAT